MQITATSKGTAPHVVGDIDGQLKNYADREGHAPMWPALASVRDYARTAVAARLNAKDYEEDEKLIAVVTVTVSVIPEKRATNQEKAMESAFVDSVLPEADRRHEKKEKAKK